MSESKSQVLQALETTYLQMLSHSELRKTDCGLRKGQLNIRELQRDWRFNRDMYFRVGENWKWIDKRPWMDEQWKEYANDPNLRAFAGRYENALIGYYELLRHRSKLQAATTAATEDDVEIAYFGLLPEFIGRGLGGALLTSAIENAWAWSPTPSRVWVHTCNRDYPGALNNYKARGFRVYKVERETAG
jgi:GNAT superfamily N-acetyltransferase